ncbi:hypothetical protein ACLK2B_15555 [Escherichia coli]
MGKLIAFWDDNGISIDGHVEGWFTDEIAPFRSLRLARYPGRGTATARKPSMGASKPPAPRPASRP